LTASSLVERETTHRATGVDVDVADGEEAVGYTPTDGEEVEVYTSEEADGDEEDAEEFELPVMKLATGGPGNVY